MLSDGLKSDFNERYKIWKPDLTEGTEWTEGFAEGWMKPDFSDEIEVMET